MTRFPRFRFSLRTLVVFVLLVRDSIDDGGRLSPGRRKGKNS
jgi:hypothetical protein